MFVAPDQETSTPTQRRSANTKKNVPSFIGQAPDYKNDLNRLFGRIRERMNIMENLVIDGWATLHTPNSDGKIEIQFRENKNQNISAYVPFAELKAWVESVQKTEPTNQTECRLWELDLEDNWVKFEVPQAVMDKGFHGGAALIDFTGLQD